MDAKSFTEQFVIKQLEDLTRDKALGLITLSGILPQLVKILDESGVLGIVYLDLTRINELENNFGWQIYDNFLKRLSQILIKFAENYSHLCLQPTLLNRSSDHFLLFFPPTHSNEMNLKQVEEYERLLHNWIAKHMPSLATMFDMKAIPFHYGNAIVSNQPLVRAERCLYRGIERAQHMAIDHEKRETTRLMNQIMKLVNNEEIVTKYQPIYRVSDMSILGYEALSSTKVDAEFQNTELLFSIADKLGIVGDLDRLCRLKAIERASPWMNDEIKLFLNTSPTAIDDRPFDEGRFFSKLQQSGILPTSIVLEITERREITDFEMFVKNINVLKNSGLKIAVDDAGAGYASLNSIAELRPDFLKFDMIMVRDIDKNLIKQDLCKTILDLSEKINALMIAEGIETQEEFETVKKIGVHLGQGYYLSRPQLNPLNGK